MALTTKQMDFLDKYAATGNARQSYKDAYGVSNNQSASTNAWKVLQREEAQEYLRYSRAQARNKRIADLEECLEKLTEIIREGNNAEILKAIDMRLKTLGAYVSKSEIKVAPTVIKVSIEESEEGKNED